MFCPPAKYNANIITVLRQNAKQFFYIGHVYLLFTQKPEKSFICH